MSCSTIFITVRWQLKLYTLLKNITKELKNIFNTQGIGKKISKKSSLLKKIN